MHEPLEPSTRTSFVAGALLIAATVLEIAAMAHHPTVHTADAAQAMRKIADLAALAGWVHGTLLALMLVITYGLSEFVLRRGLARPLVRAGTITYAVGVLIMFGAAMVSGFIVGELVALTPHATAVDLQINAQLLILCRVLNQTCANVGAIAMSAGILLWSIDLLRSNGVVRLLGVLGLFVAVLPAGALIAGLMHLDLPGMTLVVLLQALWNVALGAAMLRGRI